MKALNLKDENIKKQNPFDSILEKIDVLQDWSQINHAQPTVKPQILNNINVKNASKINYDP